MTDLLAPAEIAELDRDRREAQAERAWEAQLEAIQFEAEEALRTPEGVKTLIEENWLAYHLASIFWHLENAISEIGKFEAKDTIALRGLLQAAHKMHKSFFEQKVEELSE